MRENESEFEFLMGIRFRGGKPVQKDDLYLLGIGNDLKYPDLLRIPMKKFVNFELRRNHHDILSSHG